MTKITVDTALLRELRQAQHHVELCDEQGQAVGYFVPMSLPLSDFLSGPQISAEELVRREREGGYISTAELLRRLEAS